MAPFVGCQKYHIREEATTFTGISTWFVRLDNASRRGICPLTIPLLLLGYWLAWCYRSCSIIHHVGSTGTSARPAWLSHHRTQAILFGLSGHAVTVGHPVRKHVYVRTRQRRQGRVVYAENGYVSIQLLLFIGLSSELRIVGAVYVTLMLGQHTLPTHGRDIATPLSVNEGHTVLNTLAHWRGLVMTAMK